jgi:peptidyl-tRNA hydrolase, PTH1 family
MNIRLVVGLGNPGSKYDRTRHNAGFWFVDELARHLSGQFRMDAKFHSELLRTNHHSRDLWLMKPQTFMNRSGQAVGALARFFKIPPEEILVIHDELDIDPGRLKLKQGGGHGGHNGLKDIQAALGSADFWRLRVGIGHPGHRDQVVAFVLKAAPASEQQLIEQAIDYAAEHVTLLLDGPKEQAVERINGYRP